MPGLEVPLVTILFPRSTTLSRLSSKVNRRAMLFGLPFVQRTCQETHVAVEEGI